MATGWGVDATKNASGEVTSGTSSQDVRRIIDGMYNQGVMQGCSISTSTSDMSYTLNEGVVVNWIGGREAVLMPVYTTKVTVSPNTGTAPRNDFVYVKQNLPSIDGNSNIVVGVTNTEPSASDRRLVIRKFVVPAGATKTSSAVPTGSMNYSTPYGQSGRLLVNKTDTYNGLLRNRTLNDMGGNFSLSTDRIVRVDMTVTFDLEGSFTGHDRLVNEIFVDGVARAKFSTGLITTGAYETKSWTWYTQLYRGDHNITLKRFSWYKQVNNKPSEIYLRYNANQWPGQTLVVTDAGVWD